jgi:hypothetical protein
LGTRSGPPGLEGNSPNVAEMRTIVRGRRAFMRRTALIALFLATAAVAATVAPTATPKPSAETCGGLLWRLKTFSDARRARVSMAPHQTTIAALASRRSPRPLPRSRRTSFQRQTWQVVAQITEYRLDGNELRLVLFDDGAYMNAVVPAPACLSATTRARGTITSVWSAFSSSCGHPQRAWQPQGAVVYISGVGFWSSRFKTRRGAAPNGAELHPVTGLRAVAGCGN